MHQRLCVAALLSSVVLCACASYRHCPEPAPELLARGPKLLSQTGLYASRSSSHELQPGVTPYTPQFQLWSDGASKRRFIWLPPGAQIDTRDPDAWQFPAGTKLWKEFSVDGKRIETRYLEKLGPGPDDWLALPFVWRAQQDDAVVASTGASDALGTGHDVPAARDCMGCHGGTASRVLGFSAIQLNRTAPAGEWSVARLAADGVITDPVVLADVPGDADTRRALGYLHANCGHCHNQQRPAERSDGRCYNPRRDFDLSLRVDQLADIRRTGVFATAMHEVIEPGKPRSSVLYKRAHGSFFRPRMPPLATEQLDPELLPLLDRWIAALPTSED
jgi:hypothetical protein